MKINFVRTSLLVAFGFSSFHSVAESIEQITVTASPSERKLSELSSNLSVVNHEQLALIKHEHVNQSINRVPGGWVSRGNGQEHLTAVRSPVLTGAGGCGAFVMAQDSISLRAPGFCNTNQLFDANTEQAERIEVLRGPSSALYGSNAVHGVINVVTPDAFNEKPSSIGLIMGPHDYYRTDISAGQVGDKHAFLVYGTGTHDGGYKDNSGFDQQKVNVIHQFQEDNIIIKSVIAATNLNQETAGFIQGFEVYKDDAVKKENPNPEAFRDSKSFRAYSDIHVVDSSSVSYRFMPYVRWADMTFLQHFLPWQPVEKNDQKSAGIKASVETRAEHLTWVAGVDVDFTEGALSEVQASDFSPTIPAGEHYDYTVDAQVYSPYLNANWYLSEHMNMNVGIRYDMTRYDYDNHLTDGSACAPDVDNCRFTRPTDQSVDYDELSYQFGVNYSLSANHRLYGMYSKGYRAPQATELFRLQAGQVVAELDAEQIDSIEIGVRGQVDDLFYDVTAFTMDKDNFIFQDTNRQNISDGKTTHQGVEFALSYQFLEDFYLSANGTLAQHEYDSSLTLSRVDIKGNEIDTAPEHMGSVQLGWKGTEGQTVELEWVHLGNYFLNPENTAEYDGHELLNLRFSAELGNRWAMNARVLNLTDEDYAERADFGFGNYRYFVGEPRSLYVGITYLFGS